jgi:hypothetical protein
VDQDVHRAEDEGVGGGHRKSRHRISG